MSAEPQFILHASDPASQGTLREYITIRKRQGATSLELERLHQQLLEFAGWIRNQTRPPVIQAVAPPKKPAVKDEDAPTVADAVDASYAAARQEAKAKKKKR